MSYPWPLSMFRKAVSVMGVLGLCAPRYIPSSDLRFCRSLIPAGCVPLTFQPIRAFGGVRGGVSERAWVFAALPVCPLQQLWFQLPARQAHLASGFHQVTQSPWAPFTSSFCLSSLRMVVASCSSYLWAVLFSSRNLPSLCTQFLQWHVLCCK